MAGVKGRSGGHNAKTVKQHRLEGTLRKSRHAGVRNPDPPEVPAETLKPPVPLKAAERAEWKRMVARLQTAKTLTQVDDAALLQLVRLFVETEEIVKEHREVKTLSAQLKRVIRKLEGSDLVRAVAEIVKLQQILAGHRRDLRLGHLAMRQYIVEFGLTPSSRGRVKLPDEGESGDVFSEFDQAPTLMLVKGTGKKR